MKREVKALAMGLAIGGWMLFPTVVLAEEESPDEMCAEGYVYVPQSLPGYHAECEDPDQLMASIEDQLDAAGQPQTAMALNDWYSWYAGDAAAEQYIITQSEQILEQVSQDA